MPIEFQKHYSKRTISKKANSLARIVKNKYFQSLKFIQKNKIFQKCSKQYETFH